MKAKVILIITALLISLFAGCGQQPEQQPQQQEQQQPPQTTPPETTPDVVTTASIVNTAEAFEKAISNNGTWLIAIVQDLSINKDLVVDGEFKNGKKDDQGKDIIQRKIALYAQDENRKVTARYTLTAPKITFNSPYGSLEHGTFKGDVYVSGSNFKLVNQKIEGNLYFLNEDAQKTFKIADKEDGPKSTVTGKQELKK
jgi:hypothetical protein